MRKEYNKLVRDNIPGIIQEQGREYRTVTMSKAEYLQALRNKLIEEAQEAAEASTQNVIELADLYEIIDAVIVAYGIDRELVIKEQRQRRTERGGFDKRIRL